ncbi:MAG TPA: hypothetical protein VF503_02485 [Sphingobium sp.]|uniref:hypothetical protein n=1 Tax=Sphingobium sp. TaxID=1912891 RepID=UPI002ECFD248
MENTTIFLKWKIPLPIALALFIGIAIRMILSLHGYNYDVISYRIVSDIMDLGGNVYAETDRYNYAPFWFYTLHALDMLPSLGLNPLIALRIKVATLLTVVDVGIFVFLLQRYEFRIAVLFFLNPISIIISGHHNQFDNIAIFIALIAIAIMTEGSDSSIDKIGPRWLLGLVGLGLSLCIKHILFLFPFWLALKEPSWRRKIGTITIPIGIFLGSFAPYWTAGHEGIVQNVFQYRSFQNGPLWYAVLPHVLFEILPQTLLFIGSLTLMGFAVRERTRFDSLLIYLLAVIIFSSALANQYLAIPVTAIAILWNTEFFIFTVVMTVFLLVHDDGLHLLSPLGDGLTFRGYPSQFFYSIGIIILGIGLARILLSEHWQRAISLLRQIILSFWKWIKTEMLNQFRTPF